MSKENWAPSLTFVWQMNYDSPRQGYHITSGDTGKGTKGGVIEETWAGAVAAGLVTGELKDASDNQLSIVLRGEFWGPVCDQLPAGLDFILFNGRMMSGKYPRLFQQCLGLIGDKEVDGAIGPGTLALVPAAHVPTLIRALSGVHEAYLQNLNEPGFLKGWTGRIRAAMDLGLTMAARPVA